MQNLPIFDVLPQIKIALNRHNRLVLQAPPGAGKTTALPLELLKESWLEGRKIIMLEPRRLAARSCAMRMAELLGEQVGETVGYQVKMDARHSEQTRLLIVTEGILTRKLQGDPALEEYALVIFDEFHERSIHADLALALTLQSQALLREELKILVMSATLNTTAIAALLDDAPLIQSEGRCYPVTTHYLDAKTPQPDFKTLAGMVSQYLSKVLSEEAGNVLVFLPGVAEIKAVEKSLLATHTQNAIEVSCLYGNLSKVEQDRAILPPKQGKRKVVLSTNIAQTSLTIEGITIVIDAGLERQASFNSSSGMNALKTVFISEDAAIQRSGRAGRLSAGVCYRLWHKNKILQKHDTPEILQADLTPLVLELCLWGAESLDELAWMDRPNPHALEHAYELLLELGALDTQRQITPHGKQMAQMGLHPRLAHMILKARPLGCEYEASLLAVLINAKDIFSQKDTDLSARVMALHALSRGESLGNTVNIAHAKELLKEAKLLCTHSKATLELDMLGVLLAFAYPDRIAKRRREHQGDYLLSNGKGAFLSPEDPLFNLPYLVISDLDGNEKNARVYKALPLDEAVLYEYLEELIHEEESLSWNVSAGRIDARLSVCLGELVLEEKPLKEISKEAVKRLMLEQVKTQGLGLLTWSKEAAQFQARCECLHLHRGLLAEEFPDLSRETLGRDLGWLEPYLDEISSLKALQKLELKPILEGLLSWEQLQRLDALVPAKLDVASGSKIAIDYSDPKQPVLAVRLQEMFGTRETPSILNGRLTLMLHLLSPAHRPMQMTMDLASFWQNTYTEVKKELRGKYKKHYWPDDPLEAQATAKTKKFM